MNLLDRAIAASLPLIPKPLVWKVASRYVAGETRADALRVTAKLNEQGVRTTIDLLGEDIQRLDQTETAAREYRALLEDIHECGLDASLSIKLTQLGLRLDKDFCYELTDGLVTRAAELRKFVRIDMEDSSCTSDTLEIYERLRKQHENVGVAIQAYLRRTADDVTRLEPLVPNFRLCKGVYVEPRKIAFRDMRVINRNYVAILERLLRNGSWVAIATHDEVMVWEAFRLLQEFKTPGSQYEFQMLLGVEEELRSIIHNAGHNVRVYVPFGRDWYKYSLRRLRENPRLAGYVLKAMLKR
jgi:proline dehydrogenase